VLTRGPHCTYAQQLPLLRMITSEHAMKGSLMPAGPTVHVHPASYLVSLWPEGHDCRDMATWSLLVTYRGQGWWAIELGWSHGSMKPVLGADGHWHIDERGNLALRHRLDDALRLTRSHAATATVNGVTAAEALTRHEQAGCPDE
jgi:hypothetical protein